MLGATEAGRNSTKKFNDLLKAKSRLARQSRAWDQQTQREFTPTCRSVSTDIHQMGAPKKDWGGGETRESLSVIQTQKKLQLKESHEALSPRVLLP